jgi:hypothetical protein
LVTTAKVHTGEDLKESGEGLPELESEV